MKNYWLWILVILLFCSCFNRYLSEDLLGVPNISLNGSSTINLLLGDRFIDPGATASNTLGDVITSSITTSGTIDTSSTGTYTVVYSVADAEGNENSITRIVVVNTPPDTTVPTITLTGSTTLILEIGNNFTDPGATANDLVDGDLTSSITTSGTIDTSSSGTYILVYSVADAEGNSNSVTRTIVVNTPPDTTAPTITLTGSTTLILEIGNNFTDPGATANDLVDGDLTSSITTSGTIDTSSTGTYTLVYSVADAEGNSNSVTRTVVVFFPTDISPPIITLIGSDIINIEIGAVFTDPGATANDLVDGDLTSSIITSGAIDTSSTGTYTLVYSVADAEGNSNAVTRTVITRPIGAIYFDGETCKCPSANIGDSVVINGIRYLVVDDSTLRTEIAADNIFLCTSQVTNMSSLFASNASFNENISFWDTSQVTTMEGMFFSASTFNQPIGNWDTSSVTTMRFMFLQAKLFNQDIGNWDTSQVTTMEEMLNAWYPNPGDFNQDIGRWNTENVTTMRYMFANQVNFNQNIGNWNVSSVIEMYGMFFDTNSFNQNLSSWDVLNVTTNCSEVYDINTITWTLPKPNFPNCSTP